MTATLQYRIPQGMSLEYKKEHATWSKLIRTKQPMCERWQDFAAFVDDMAPKPPFGMLKRRDESQPYGPDNCYWD